MFCSGDTVWEFVTSSLGAQSAVLAGGRYDRLATLLGAPKPIPVRAISLFRTGFVCMCAYLQAVGWAAGMERLLMLLADKTPAVTTTNKHVAVVEVCLREL
jgi:histidyl-tRNA synthetase